jgi:hypothetical protein
VDPHTTRSPQSAVRPSAAADLATHRAALAELEALEDELRQRAAHLRARLAPDEFRLAWELRDAEERHGQAERLLTIHRLAAELMRELPAHAATIRAAVGRLLGEGVDADGPA